MKHPSTRFAALVAIIPSVAFAGATTTTIFKDAADLANVTRTTGTNATITVVNGTSTPVASALDGDALLFSDTSTSVLPTANYQAGFGVADALKISFDVKIASISSNIVFRMGPTASGAAAVSVSTLGVQLTNSGTAVAEQGATVGSGTAANISYASSYSTVNRFNVTIFFNDSDTEMDLTAYDGPAALAAKQWALYVDGVSKSASLSERYVHVLDTDFGLTWRAGTSAAGNSINFQLDNLAVTNISAIPEPSTYAALLGLGTLGFATLRRRRAV
ncbi:MAG: PEP-CTERM sorting domain-containing protein [Opitutaceae bacterium]|jgi:hypothetical protein|nr:PEP-CTERM sorting domain-containing protein [Opitutaceae bacterium]